jgi:uncharacterized protein (TIGR02217 family)
VSATFPTLRQGWSVFKEPQFKTRIQRGISGRELRLTFQPVPTWQFKLTYEVLADPFDTRQVGWPGTTLNELRTIMGFFLDQQGSLSPFFFEDPTDNSATGQVIGVGNGITSQFQLVRTMNSFNEPIVAPKHVSNIYLNGAPTNDYTVGLNGIVDFVLTPASGVVITADFTYFFFCRFADDTLSFENFMYQLWSLKEVKLQSVLI